LTGTPSSVLRGSAARAGRQINGANIDIGMGPDGTTPVGLVARDNVQLMLPGEPSVPARTIRAADHERKRGALAAV